MLFFVDINQEIVCKGFKPGKKRGKCGIKLRRNQKYIVYLQA